jgi:hypothetical protein
MIDGAVVERGGLLQLSGLSVGDIAVQAGISLEVNGPVNEQQWWERENLRSVTFYPRK